MRCPTPLVTRGGFSISYYCNHCGFVQPPRAPARACVLRDSNRLWWCLAGNPDVLAPVGAFASSSGLRVHYYTTTSNFLAIGKGAAFGVPMLACLRGPACQWKFLLNRAAAQVFQVPANPERQAASSPGRFNRRFERGRTCSVALRVDFDRRSRYRVLKYRPVDCKEAPHKGVTGSVPDSIVSWGA